MPSVQQGFVITNTAQIVDGIIATADIADDAITTQKINNGAVTEAKQTLADNTTGDVSITKHGYAPKAPNDTTKFLDGAGAYDTVKDSDLALTDITDNNVSTTKHGLVPKAPNSTAQFLRGDATWAAPGGMLAQAGAGTVIASTAAETNILSVSVPGGTLGTGGALLIRIWFSALGRATGTPTFRLKYGATTLASFQLADPGNSQNSWFGKIDAVLLANAATNAQRGRMTLDGCKNIWVVGGSDNNIFQAAVGTATEDSTGALNLVLSVQHGASSAGDTITIDGFTVSQL